MSHPHPRPAPTTAPRDDDPTTPARAIPADQPAQAAQAARRAVSRRHALTGVVGVGLGLPMLAACGDDGGTTATDATDAPSSPQSSATSSGPAAGGGGGGDALASTSDVPVGGGTILTEDEVVLTQPTDGEFKAFSVTCTHQGCPVDSVSGDGIVCPCHGSVFSIADGSPTAGPATAPLEEIAIKVSGDSITLA